MTDWFEEHSDAMEALMNTYDTLEHLAESFYSTGNTVMAEQLGDIANDILDSHKKARDAVGKSINDRYKQGQQTYKDTLQAVINHYY